MLEKEEYIGKSKLHGQPKKPLNFKLKDMAIKTKHLDDEAVTTPKIKDKSVTPEKRSDNFDNVVVKPYVSSVDEKYNTITNELDEKYEDVTQELYSMIASLQVGGIALSGKFGNRTDIGIHQKALTKAIGRIWDELGTITGKTYMDYTMEVTPDFIAKEGAAQVTVTADCSDSVSDFDAIQLYVNGQLVHESHDVTRYSHTFTIEDYGTSEIETRGVIMGKTINKRKEVEKVLPFFMGGGQEYTDVMVPECAKQLDGTLEGDYDVTINSDGEYMFIIIPISHKDEFRRADMNGLGLQVEIPLEATEMPDYVVYKSLNTYKAGTYNIDIDINS